VNLKNLKQEVKNLRKESEQTQQKLESLDTKTDQKIKDIKKGIESGSIVAQKALMLKGKDNEHWIKFRKLDGANHHCLQVWRNDNTWHDDIKVKSAIFLQASDDKHWMRYKYLTDGKYHTFYIWHVDDTWHHCVRVGAAKKIRE
jgi:hypothetical protein